MRRRLVAGVAAIATLTAVVGPTAARDLAGLPPRRAATVVLVGAAPTIVWGVSLHLASRGLDTTQSLARSLAGFAATSFCNVVTPFGQAGGDPPAAVVVGRGFDTRFEPALAAATTPPVLVAVPVAKIGEFFPTPGGTETTLTATLVAAGVDSAAGVAVLLQRFAAFWLPSAVGGLAAAWLTAHPFSDATSVADETGATDETHATNGTRTTDVTHAADGATARTRTTDETVETRERGRRFDFPRLLVGFAIAVAIVVTHAFVHESGPRVVHATRDAAVAVVFTTTAWLLIDRVAARLDR